MNTPEVGTNAQGIGPVVPLIFWIVVCVFALGLLVLGVVLVRMKARISALDADLTGIDRDLNVAEKAIKAHKSALGVLQHTAASTNPTMAVVRPGVPARHSRPRLPYDGV